MPSQERFEELVSFAKKGNIELMDAIRTAQHESLHERVKETAKLLKIIQECRIFFSEHPNPESEELLKKCTEEIENVKKRLQSVRKLVHEPVKLLQSPIKKA